MEWHRIPTEICALYIVAFKVDHRAVACDVTTVTFTEDGFIEFGTRIQRDRGKGRDGLIRIPRDTGDPRYLFYGPLPDEDLLMDELFYDEEE
jgi:hypothetical protein